MSFPMNYALRQTNGALKGNLGWLFTMYYLHCDNLLRCYPSDNLLMKETGIESTATIKKHRDKLIEMKALMLVPYEKRLSPKEKQLHQRKYVYQLTGVIQLPDGKIAPTVHINNPESLETHHSILKDLEFDVSLFEQAFNFKPLENEDLNLQKLKVSKIKAEVVHIKDSKDNTKEESKGNDSKSSKKRTIHPDFDEMCLTVQKELKQYGKQKEKVAKALLGILDNGASEHNLEIPIIPSQLIEFCEDWDRTKRDKNNEPLTRPKNLGSVKSWVTTWQEKNEQASQINSNIRVVDRFESGVPNGYVSEYED